MIPHRFPLSLHPVSSKKIHIFKGEWAVLAQNIIIFLHWDTEENKKSMKLDYLIYNTTFKNAILILRAAASGMFLGSNNSGER